MQSILIYLLKRVVGIGAQHLEREKDRIRESHKQEVSPTQKPADKIDERIY